MQIFSNKTLIRIITIVHAKSSSVIRYNFALYNSLPIESAGKPITSAAIPDLKHNPIPILHAEINAG